MFCAQAEPSVILLELVDLAEILLLQKEFQTLFFIALDPAVIFSQQGRNGVPGTVCKAVK